MLPGLNTSAGLHQTLDQPGRAVTRREPQKEAELVFPHGYVHGQGIGAHGPNIESPDMPALRAKAHDSAISKTADSVFPRLSTY